MALADRIVDVAAGWLKRGCVETTPNRGVCVDEIHQRFDPKWIAQQRAEAWCAKFAWVVVDEAIRDDGGTDNPLPRTAGARDMLDKAYAKGLGVDKSPAVGSVFYRRSEAAGASGHVGIVVGVGGGQIKTIEGNLDNRVALHYYPDATWRDPYWRFNFIHTERINTPGEPAAGFLTAGGGLTSLIMLSAVAGAAYTLWKGRKK